MSSSAKNTSPIRKCDQETVYSVSSTCFSECSALFTVFIFKIFEHHGRHASAAAAAPADPVRPSPAPLYPIGADDLLAARPVCPPDGGDKSPVSPPTAGGSSGVNCRRHRRGRRAGRLVQARRRLAIDAEHQRGLDYDRALIPLGPGLASGIEACSSAQTRADRPGLTADSCQGDPGSGSSLRVEGHPSRPPLNGGRQPTPPDQRRCSATLALGHVNVNSLAGKIDLINKFLLDHDIDILCMSETKLVGTGKTKFDPMTFPGYIFYRQDRSAPKLGKTEISGGEVGILCRNSLSSKRVKMDCSDSSVETIWVSAVGRARFVGRGRRRHCK